MRPPRLFNEQNLLLLLSVIVAVTSWYYVVTTQNPRVPRTTSKTVAVIPVLVGEPAYGYSLLGVRVTPPTVIISGTPEGLAQIETVRTEPVVVTGATRDVVKDVGVVGSVEIARSIRVNVAVQVVPAIAATVVRGVRIRVDNVPRGLEARVEPATVDVQVQGPVALISKLRPQDLQARIDGTGLAAGRSPRVPEVQVPAQVTVLSVNPATVLVVIRRG